MQHGPPNRGLTRLEVAAMVVVSGIFAFLVANALPLLNGEGSLPRRAVCSANIRDIIQGMYEYAQSDNGCFPNVPPAGGIFINGAIPCAVPSARGTYDKKTGFIPSRKNGRMAVRSLAGSPLACLWLTVTNGWVRPTAFICPADPNAISPSIEFAGRVDNSRRYYLNFGMGYDGPLRSGGGESYSFAYPWVHGGPAAWWNDGSNIPNSYQTPLVSDMAPMQDLRAAGREKRIYRTLPPSLPLPSG